ncbi:hypothetical protein K0C01_05170 [Salinarchaeum sp. IM2453]|uniref:hypothetical protein n=1 Tax=Salinarchaeum sp. IM2453 TaxID=2862870 RepID=UPI001C82FE9D|nr:hypothetical protein [Salinarchaeum sp. IM2453]QZA89524.1 hypothetical protein K0C01_05170 [Salinarchaeum sp. IM2453]
MSAAINAYTYDATLYAPLFYASKEGSVIETDPTIAATALMHAIGYDYYDLEKRYALVGDDATSPAYERLQSLPFLVSEMVPTEEVQAEERTFRTVSYATERTVVSQDGSVGEFIRGTKKPVPRRIEGSNSGWHKVRKYIGLPPGTSFEFTVWASPDNAPPERLGFRTGIKRTGEFRAERRNEPADTVTLNQYLLQSVYDIDNDLIYGLMERSDEYQRGNDVRTNRFIDVDRPWAEQKIVKSIIS